MVATAIPNQSQRKAMIDLLYDPDTGALWRPGRSKPDMDDIVENRYVKIYVDGRPFLSHRVIWFKMTGEWPHHDMVIDHINGVKFDNRIINLRLATNSENSRNRHMKYKIQGIIDAFKRAGVRHSIVKTKTLISIRIRPAFSNRAFDIVFDRKTGIYHDSMMKEVEE